MDGTPGRIPYLLIVDCDVWSRAALAVLLRPHVLVETASTASDGLSRLHNGSPDLVLLDVCLPDLDGADVLRALRARHPACPVVVLVTPERTESLQELTALGIDGLFRKPLEVGGLLERIRDLLPAGSGPSLESLRFSPHICQAVEHLSRTAPPLPSVEGLAQAIGLSASYLSHLFRAETRMTMREYLARVRVEVTKRTLRETRRNLESVSEAVGFSDASHLSRVFRKYVGRRPGAYRRRPDAA